jgi:hypothetical protein
MEEDHAVQFWTAAGYIERGGAGRFVKNMT